MRKKPHQDMPAGRAVPDSKYVRAYCRCCGEPMRVSKETFENGGYPDCHDCTHPLPLGHGTQNDTGEYDEHDGAWDNAVRAWEDAA